MKNITNNHRILKIILSIFMAVVLIIGGFAAFVLLGKEKTLNTELQGVLLSDVADGAYMGSYSGFRWSNTIEVVIEDHRITDIHETKSQVFVSDETIKTLTDRVLSKQTTKVDVITGATADSKAFLKAVENAFKKQQ